MVSKSAQRVAFVADELLGYAGNGIGTTTTFVSLALARAGHDIEILFVGTAPSGPIEPEWQRLYDDANVRVRVVPRGEENVEPGPFARARDLEQVLRADPPDVVVVQDLGAPAYTSLRFRRLGLAFEQTSFVVFCHGTRQWITDVSRKVRVLPGAHLPADVCDPLPGPVTEHDEGGLLERETEPAEAKRGVRRSAEVLDDDDVR